MCSRHAWAIAVLALAGGCGGETESGASGGGTSSGGAISAGSGGAISGGSGGASGGSGGATSGGSGGAISGGSGGAISGGSGGSSGTDAGVGGTGGVAASCPPQPSAGTICGSSTCTCGTTTCNSHKLAGVLDVPPCCTDTATCGSYFSKTVGQLIKAGEGCYEANQAGKPDSSCPAFEYIDPLSKNKQALAGCCRAEGKCGYVIDLSSLSGPNFGCVLAKCPGASPQACKP